LKLISFFCAFMLLYGLLHYYIGLRGWQAFRNMGIFSWMPAWNWALLVTLLALLYPLSRAAVNFLPRKAAQVLIFAGSYWMAILYYLLLIVLAVDLLRLINHFTGFFPHNLFKLPAFLGMGALLFIMLILLYGTWNANHPVVRDYELIVDKKPEDIKELRIAVVSDIHLGWIVGIDRMAGMVKTINSLQPDLVFMVGDIIDEGVDPLSERKIPAMLGSLNPRYGAYAVLGNHEYISGNVEKTAGYMDKADITVLRDQWAKVAGSIYVVGRDDQACKRFSGHERLSLTALMSEIPRQDLPIILLAHEPVELEIAEIEGVDVQFSGHTHLGQLFPNNFITQAIYENDWGYLKKGNLQVVVSAGFGTWGPPIRIGNRPEIVNVLVKFQS
jgi:predicted MPP superfamily phosphohydrolase